MDTLKLDTAVGLLTRPSKHRLVDSTGAVQWVTADPLLVQLLVAVGNSSAATSFKSSTGTPLPISADAHDLLERIADETAEHWWQTHALHHGHGRTTLGGQIRAWALAARSNEALLAEATKIISSWVRQIEDLFMPLRRWEIRGYCPACKASRIVDRADEEGHSIMRPALEIVFDKNNVLDSANCGACHTQWDRDDVVALARFVAAQREDEDAS